MKQVLFRAFFNAKRTGRALSYSLKGEGTDTGKGLGVSKPNQDIVKLPSGQDMDSTSSNQRTL